MTRRKVRASFIFAVAGLALGLLGTGSAAAAGYSVESAPALVLGSGEGSQVFKAGATLSCNKKGDSALMSTVSSPTLTIEPTLFECSLAGQAVSINFNGCKFKLGEPTGTTSPYLIKTITIECPPEKEIVIKMVSTGCTLKYASQTTTGTSAGTNLGSGIFRTVKVSWAISNLKYTGSGGLCGGSGTNGTYTGQEMFRAYKGETNQIQQGFFIG